MNWYKTALLQSNPFAPDPRKQQNPNAKVPSKKPVDPKETLKHKPPTRKEKQDMMPMNEQIAKFKSNPSAIVNPKDVPNQNANLARGKNLAPKDKTILNQVMPDLERAVPTAGQGMKGNPETQKATFNLLKDMTQQQNPSNVLTPTVRKMQNIINQNTKQQEHDQAAKDLKEQTAMDQQEAHDKTTIQQDQQGQQK